jgi:hypothetical protein
VLGGYVVDEHEKGCVVQLLDLAVVHSATGRAEPGTAVTVRVEEADIEAGRISLAVVG